MKRSEILIVIYIILLMGICGFSVFIWSSTIDSYNIIEQNELNTTLNYIRSGIDDQKQQINIQARDYAWWDDTYHYILGEYPDYVTANFNEHTLSNLNIQLVLLIDNNGTLINQTWVKPEIRLHTEDEKEKIVSLFAVRNENESTSGLLTIDQTTLLFCGVPILHSDASGPVAGTLVFGREIDDTFLLSLEKTVHYPLSFVMNRSAFNRDFIIEKHILPYPSFKAYITDEDPDTIENAFYTISSDDQTILTFGLQRPKTVALQGREIIGKSLLYLIIFALLYVFVMTLILLNAFSRYDKTRDELERKNQKIHTMAEKKKISDNIETILNTFLAFKLDSTENIQQLVNLTAEMLLGDCVIYSKMINGVDTLVASSPLPDGYMYGQEPVGHNCSALFGPGSQEICLVQSFLDPEFRESNPLAKKFGFQTLYGCRVSFNLQNPGYLSVYYRDHYSPRDFDGVLLHLIVNAISYEETRASAHNALKKRDTILESVSLAATNLINQGKTPDFHNIFRMLGEILQVSRVYILIPPEKREELSGDPRYDPWVCDEEFLKTSPLIPYYTEWGDDFSEWITHLKSGEFIAGSGNPDTSNQWDFLERTGIKSLALFPFFRKTKLFGILVFEDHQKPREWILPECKALMTAATLIGSTFERVEVERLNEQYTIQLTEKSHELASMNVEIQERSYLIERLLDRKNDLITQIGHDIRTPLTPIIGLLPLIKRDITNPKTLSLIDHVEIGAYRIRNLLDKILVLKQMQTSDEDEEWGYTEVYSLVQKTYEKNLDSLQGKEIIFKNSIQQGLYILIPDKSLNLVLDELLRNAIRFTRDGGSISFGAELNELSVTISVSDNGIGLSAEDKARIFEDFYKADTARHSIDTHGLGLPIVKQVIGKYHGTITASSDGPGLGTTVSVTLPLKKE